MYPDRAARVGNSYAIDTPGEIDMVSKADFEDAAKRVLELPEKPSNDNLLDLYSLYKQATEGDVSGDKPGMFDFAGRAKYDAWEDREGMSADDAMTAYVELVNKLEEG